jgi:hypothetical protein
MKRYLPSILLALLVSFSLKAQNLEVTDTLVYINLEPNEVLKIADVPVKNISGTETINVFWERITNDLPQGYISYICDNNICYGPLQSECPTENPNTMGPNYEFKFKLNLEKNGNGEGPGLVEVLIWEEGKKDQAIKVKFLVNQGTSTSPFYKNALKVFPNPADNYFRIDNSQDISHAVVFNIVCEEMITYNVAPDMSYDISHLNSGIYLVKLIRSNGKIAKTIRLSKR